MDVFFSFFRILFPIFFIAVFGAIIAMIIKTVSAEAAERRLPVEEKWARVVTKRPEVSGSETTRTRYYVTVEFDDGTRNELNADGSVYGSVAEGDMGRASIQGSRLAGFTREADRKEASSPWHRCPACNAVFRGDTCEYCGTPWMGDK